MKLFKCLLLLSLFSQGKSGDNACRASTENCVCDSTSIIDSFNELLMVKRSVYMRAPDVITNKISKYSCEVYAPLPPFLSLQLPDAVDTKYYLARRRYLRYKRSAPVPLLSSERKIRSKRQVSLGFPTDEKFASIVATIPKRSNHHYTPLGSEVSLHCFGDGSNGIEENLFGAARKFEWTHVNGLPITAPLVIKDQVSGDLTFTSVQLADTGIYNCSVVFEEESEHSEQKSYLSQLDVVSEPMLWLRFGVTYETDRCRHKELLFVQDKIRDWVHQYVCHFCPVRNVSVNCLGLDENHGRNEPRFVQITLALSTLGFERRVPAWRHYSEFCPMTCVEAMHLKILNVLTSSLMKLFSLPIHVEPPDEKISVYSPVPGSVDEDVAIGCPAGFFENYKLCFPCAAGKYSPHGKSECVPCEEGYFQPNPGSSACFSCPPGHTTLEEGSLSQMECVAVAVSSLWGFMRKHWIVVIIFCVLLLLLLIILVAVCCYPESSLGRFFRCTYFCGGDSSKDDEAQEKLIQEETTAEYSDGTESNRYVTGHGQGRKGSRRQRKLEMEEDLEMGNNGNDGSSRDKGQTKGKKRELPSSQLPSFRDKLGQLSHRLREKSSSREKLVKTKNSPSESEMGKNKSRDNLLKRTLSRRDISSEKDLSSKGTVSDTESVKRRKIKKIKQLYSSPPARKPKFCSRAPVPSFPANLRRPPPGNRGNGNGSSTDNEQDENEKGGRRYPHMHLGVILNKSKSLMKKLSERKEQLDKYYTSRGARGRSRSKNRSNIEEDYNNNRINYMKPCTNCSSTHFKKTINERVKSFQG